MEIFLKLSIKYWSENVGKGVSANNALTLAKDIIERNPLLFEMGLKLIYLNYLTVGKATNIYSIVSIHEMQDNIIDILSINLEKAYITIFSFIRKMCINLRATLTDKVSQNIINYIEKSIH
jgi:hypothetical protein